MEMVILFGIGLAAFGYVGYLVWRGINGRTVCNCGGDGADQSAPNCHCKSKKSPE